MVPVSADQVLQGGSLNRLAHQLASLLGKRPRYVDPGFTHAHLALGNGLLEAIGMRKI